MASSTGSKSVKKSPSMGNLVDQQSNAVSDTELRNSIAERFERDHIYTRLGPRAVLALHPFKSIETSSDATIKSIAAADLSKEATAHVAELAWRAYYEMAQTKEDQAIFLHGVQGSGKSFCHDLALKECLALAKRAAKYEPAQRKVVAKLTSQCAKLSTILTAFGSANVGSSDASRCGKITTLQYDNESKFSGMKVSAFLLETARVVDVPSGERTFNIFYYLLAGASAEDKQSWGIDTGKFKILHAHSTNAKADAEAFTQLIDAFKAFKISSRTQTAVFRALSAILHLGSVEFVNNPKKTAEPASVVDTTPLSAAAKLLGIAKSALENQLIYKTKIIEKQEVSAFCDAAEAYEQLHALMQTLYQVCFDGLIEQANNRIRNPGTSNSIKIVDLAGHQEAKVNKLWHLASNNLNEYALQKAYNKLFVDDVEAATSEGVKVEGVSNPLGQKILPLLEAAPSVLNQLNASVAKGRVDDAEWVERMREQHGGNSCFGVKKETVSILYAAGKVAYKTGSFGVHCNVVRRRDFAPLFLGTGDYQRSKNTFLYRNFDATMQPNEQKNVAVTYESVRQEIATITDEAKLWNVLCVKSNNKGQQGFLDEAVLSTQLENYKIFQFARRSALSFSVDVGRGIFLDTICPAVEVENKSAEAAISALTAKLSLGERNGFYVGKSRIFMDATTWRLLSAALNKAQLAKLSVTEDDNDTGSVSGSTLMGEESDSGSDSGVSDAESTVSTGSMMTIADPDEGAFKKDGAINEKVVTEKPEEVQITPQRKLWVRITWALTWWIPTFTIKMAGMKRPDVIMAWREKVALCIIILLISGATLFFITGFPELLCPHQKIYTLSELAQHNDTTASLFIGVRGQVFDWTYQSHYNDDMSVVYPYGGRDASDTFYMVPDDWDECQGASYTDQKTAKPRYATISQTVPSHSSDTIIGLLSTPTKLSYWKGNVAYSDADVAAAGAESLKYWLMINNNVYEFLYYIGLGGYYYPPSFTDFIKQNAGTDATDAWNSYKISSASASSTATDLGYFTSKRQILACMNRIQFVGKHDTRDTPQCKAANGILLGTMILIVSIMVVRFLAALQLTSGTMPEIIDKFVIVQVPCYTEGEESLRKTIESAATLQYNDKYKLLFIIADGMIIGHGNDKPTPRIVLDILGVAPEADEVPALSYLALGEGAKQHNMAKVYSGLYEYSGHLVPYIAVIKCGKPNEKHRPGNRGKRDSQLILMHFFKKVYYKEPMNALELELYHQMANVIGVRAESYEFCLMIDSDTEVMPDSLVKLVAACQNNRKIMGICGETQVSNARDSFTTMIQVYEYYISHHLAKAFESLFGTVTCLPGCFSMYRIRTDEGMNPILAHKGLVDDYCENNVDTLHKKNLFSLGEDRFLTTLMLKHFPHFKTKFLGNSYAKTVVPENWSVLLSQRRRWINSTIHNLWELTRLPGLCGFFLFSMRFVVYADLYATMTMPAAMGYLVYLIYNAVNTSYISTLSLIMICAAYGLQVVIFLIKGKFEHIGWLVFYILAMPLFNVAIPIYSFWHFDDFSWGNTRVVVGETAGKKQIQDLEPFDPTVIELKTWEEHEKAMAAAGKLPGDASADARTMVQGDGGSVVSFGGNQLAIGGGTPSVIGGRSVIAVPVSIVQGPASASLAGGPSGPLPTDDQIAAEIRRYLSEADLTKTTKKQVREHLSRQFNVNLTSKKQFMNAIIDDVLSSH